jgi:hypothetical protein
MSRVLKAGMNENVTSAEQLEAMRAEMRQWTVGIRAVYILLLMVPLYYITRVLVELPQIGTLFEDMLGSRHKLLAMTLLLLDHPLEAALTVWLIALAASWAIFTLHHAKHVWVVMFVSVVFLVAAAHVTTALLMEPLMLVVKSLSGGG